MYIYIIFPIKMYILYSLVNALWTLNWFSSLIFFLFYFAFQLAAKQLQEVKETTMPIKLPEINKLQFEDLPNLIRFSCGVNVEWSTLEHMTVNQCPNIMKFGLGTIKSSQLKPVILENQEQVDIDTKIAYLFDVEVSSLSTHYVLIT